MNREIPKARRWTLYFTLGLACLAALLSVGCGKKVTAAFEQPPASVTISTAVSRDVPVYLDEIGKNGAFESVTVTPQLGGRITERHFEDGANLQKGQLLFVIDPRPFKPSLIRPRQISPKRKPHLNSPKSNLLGMRGSWERRPSRNRTTIRRRIPST